MRLPWVSRARFDLLQHNYDQLHLIARERGDQRYEALLEKYHELRLVGGNPAEPQRTIEAREPDAVQYAINEKAQGNYRLRLHLTSWAATQRAANVEPDRIVSAIEKWSRESDDE